MNYWNPDICVYHGGCDDGFGAAWAIRNRWPNVQFIAGYYGKPFHSRVEWANKNVLFVDFSTTRDALLAMMMEIPTDWPPAASIVIIDHHKTAEDALKDFPQFDGSQEGLGNSLRMCAEHGHPAISVWFDMGQSGATMAWQFAMQTDRQVDPCPEMLTLIEDRDLWRFAFGEKTKRFSAALRTYEHDFDIWDGIAADPNELITQGKDILRAHQKNVKQIAEQSFQMTIHGHDVPCCNCSYHYASDVAHELLQHFPSAPFAACWFMRDDKKLQFSLRSENNRVDVSEVAKSCGGGGHRNAAGFESDPKGWF